MILFISYIRPKIGKAKDKDQQSLRRHTKGCNCKISGCLKNYCECYEAKISCSSNCKCLGMNIFHLFSIESKLHNNSLYSILCPEGNMLFYKLSGI